MEILVCLDGSANAARAVEVSIDLARSLPAGLVGLAIVDEPERAGERSGDPGGDAGDPLPRRSLPRRARTWLTSFTARGRAAGVAVRTLDATGTPADLILAEVPRRDLTVIGRDANRFALRDHDRFFRDRILRRAGRPIVVVPERLASAGRAVVVAYDGSPAAIRALRSFADLRLARSREIHVVTVDPDGARALDTATRGCALLGQLGIRAIPDHLAASESPAAALLARSLRLRAGLIVVGGYIPSPRTRPVWGSVTHEVVEQAVVPVFLHY
jgi:nucleotide-binding universal stress UspA family protein